MFNATGVPNDEAEVYSTFSDLRYYTSTTNSILRFGILLAADVTITSFSVGIDSMYLNQINVRQITIRQYQYFKPYLLKNELTSQLHIGILHV